MPAQRTLCVAEKPSISRAITGILSGGDYQTYGTSVQWVKNYEFPYNPCNSQFVVTCVAGHITEKDFGAAHRAWHSCDPAELFDAPVETKIPQDKVKIRDNLVTQARRCQLLVIWTDCDREGEAIGAEIASICRTSNPNIRVQRARFSAIIPQQIHRAAQHTVPLDMAQADAVEARSSLDLIIGAAFTRMQTLRLQQQLDGMGESLISYGPCQFPTLGFVVSRYEQVQSFRPEPFWYIYLALDPTDEDANEENEIVFNWARGKLFEFEVSLAIYELVLANPTAHITSVKRKPTKKWKPLPLTTVELQKSGSRLLKLAPKRILDIADSLYQKGVLSYPRTETDQYDAQFDFQSLIQKQTADTAWGGFATNLQNGGFSAPRKGKKNDQAHPPIHPTAHVNNLEGDDKRVYEYVTRRFLASCSKDAEGFETVVEASVGGEIFTATGLLVTQRNYLDVFPYDKWNARPLPDFAEGQQFMPSVCELREGETSRPSLLTEADLVGLMDKNGIGTDATIAQHIQTIIDRAYVTARPEGTTKYLVPSTLGIGLVEGYNTINFEKSLSKPQLRRETERAMVQVCQRNKTKQQMLQESIEKYREVFTKATAEFEKVVTSVRDRLAQAEPVVQGARAANPPNRGGRGRGAARRGQRGGAARQNGNRRPPDDSDDDGPPAPGPAGGRAQRPVLANVNARVSNAPQTQTPNCECGVEAAQRSVTRDTANKGRAFWTCGTDQACGFFQWVEEVGSVPKPISRVGGTESAPGRCNCDMTTVSRTVTKDGPNKGRKFWACPNSEKARCGYFQWDDELDSQPQTTRTTQANGNGSGEANSRFPRGGGSAGTHPPKRIRRDDSQGQQGSCFKCGEEGHWSSACPSSNRGEAGATGDASGSCFNCGMEGHWSSNCPGGTNNNASSGRGRGDNFRGKRGSSTRGKKRGRKASY